jgi:GGDEF domain-containing protein
MYGAGGLVVLGTLALPSWPGRHAWILAAVGLVALAAAGVLFLTVGRIAPVAYHPFLMAGTVLITALVYWGSASRVPSIYACLYIWVVLYAAYFYSRRWVVVYLLVVIASYGATLLARHLAWIDLGSWLTLTGTAVVATVVVSILVDSLRRTAGSDLLTGLANRQTWEEALSREMARARREPSRTLSIAIIDVDWFKRVNDRHGHQGGDLLLRGLSAAWTQGLRESDLLTRLGGDGPSLLARYGGDEFALLLAYCDSEQACAVLTRLQSGQSEVTFSAGVATWHGSESVSELVARADAALYKAKNTGRNRIVADDTPEGASHQV